MDKATADEQRRKTLQNNAAIAREAAKRKREEEKAKNDAIELQYLNDHIKMTINNTNAKAEDITQSHTPEPQEMNEESDSEPPPNKKQKTLVTKPYEKKEKTNIGQKKSKKKKEQLQKDVEARMDINEEDLGHDPFISSELFETVRDAGLYTLKLIAPLAVALAVYVVRVADSTYPHSPKGDVVVSSREGNNKIQETYHLGDNPMVTTRRSSIVD